MQQLPYLCGGKRARQPAAFVQVTMGLPGDYKRGTK